MASQPLPDWTSALVRSRAHSPFLARALECQAELAEILARGDIAQGFAWADARGEHEDTGIGLRRQRLALATALAIGDLAGAVPLSEVVARLSDFADHALDRAIRSAIGERTGENGAQGMIALALGKQGARELNYSSDIDPILLYEPSNLACRPRDDPGDAAQRYARRVIKLLADTTADGYVFRVDMRLRPASEINPLAVPKGAALSHYQGQALAWERAAFIRARAAAGDLEAGVGFLNEIAPFVWRQALDFGAIEEIRALTLRIRKSHDGPRDPGPGFDVKRGRGGIREIEFFAQTHQLIHGGRMPELRVRETRAALDALAESGCIEIGHARALGEGYDRLREIEHRLQMVNDRQTHSLPEGAALDNVAQLDGLKDGAALIAELAVLTEETGAIYDGLIREEPRKKHSVAPVDARVEQLAQLGFDEPKSLAKRIAEWRDGRYPAVRTPQALEAFDRLLPSLLEAFAQSDDPARAVTRWQRIIERSQSAITVFRLLEARPELLERLTAALTLSRVLADQLARRPERLDVLIDQQPLAAPLSVDDIAQRMRDSAVRDDYEARLDAIRRETGEGRFVLGLRLIEAENPPIDIARILSNMAEAAIRLAVKAASDEFARQHGVIAGSELLVLGLGRLGGGMLTHASDLDMIYLFTGDFDAQSDGARPLGATLYFNRLASRVNAALSVPTAQGALYEVDTRLRPQGAQGPLAVSVEAFAKYQRESAWTWEHMALTRSRVLVGSDSARDAVNAIIAAVLSTPRSDDEVCASVLQMRGNMARHKPAKGALDVKLLRGGLVDVEFLTHFQQLRFASDHASDNPAMLSPELAKAIESLAALNLLPGEILEAHRLMADVLIASRLLAPDRKEPPKAAAKALARACNRTHYAELMHDLAVARKNVAACWAGLFDQDLEIE